MIVFGALLSVFTLSGVGYPNAETVIIGPDNRGKIDTLYDLRLEAPESVTEGGMAQARVSIEHEEGFNVVSRATLTVTGGTLRNEQAQDLLPDALWSIAAQSSSLVGVVVSVETKISPKGHTDQETTYLDTLSKSISVVKASSVTEATPIDTSTAFEENRGVLKIFGGVLFALPVVIALIIIVRKKKTG